MDRAEIESVQAEVNALAASLDEERFRHVAGMEPEPLLQRIFVGPRDPWQDSS